VIAIFEGPDGSGKSTLASKVRKQVDGFLIHSNAPLAHPLSEYAYPFLPDEDYCLDRWHIGEMVYGPLYRGGSGLTETQFDAIEEYLDSLGAIIVHCTGRSRDLAARLRERGEETSELMLSTDASAFQRVLTNRTRLPVFTSPVGCEMRAYEVVAYARDREARCAMERS
jgi:hypothetical protein